MSRDCIEDTTSLFAFNFLKNADNAFVLGCDNICHLSSVGYTTSSSGAVKALNKLYSGEKKSYFHLNYKDETRTLTSKVSLWRGNNSTGCLFTSLSD